MTDNFSSENSGRKDQLSPCIKICQTHPQTGFCVGCFRTLDEITDWRNLTDDQKLMILLEIPKRTDAHKSPEARPSFRKKNKPQE